MAALTIPQACIVISLRAIVIRSTLYVVEDSVNEEERARSVAGPADLAFRWLMPGIIVLTGASGAGKTTIVRAFAREAPPDVSCHHFDTAGVPEPEEMARKYGSGEAWQRAMTHWWIAHLQTGASGVAVAVLDAQVRPTFAREAFAAVGVTQGAIVLVDCAPAVRHARLMGDRRQPELVTPDMDAWAAYLRGQADALGLPVLDTTSGTLAEAVAALRALVESVRSA